MHVYDKQWFVDENQTDATHINVTFISDLLVSTFNSLIPHDPALVFC